MPVAFEDGDKGGSPAEFGAAARDPERRPKGWAPWRERVGTKPYSGCGLLPEALRCVTYGQDVQSRSLADGRLRWRYPGKAGTMPPVFSGDRVYVGSADGSVVGLRASDGTQLSSWPGAHGYVLTQAVADHGVVYAGYTGPAGVGTATSMLFRAYREKDGRKLWETTERSVWPQTLTVVGGYLELQGPRSVALDRKTGRRLAEAEPCQPFAVSGTALLCRRYEQGGSSVRDARTLRDGRHLPLEVAAVGEAGIALGQEPAAGTGSPVLRGVRVDTGQVLWNVDVPKPDTVPNTTYVLMGKEYLAVDEGGVQRFSLTTGEAPGKRVRPAGWPPRWAYRTAHPLVLVRGGVMWLMSGDGRIISAAMP